MTLDQYIMANRRKPFEWGVHDCAWFAAGWIKHASGIDFLAAYPSWATEEEADAVIELAGGLETVMDSKFSRINPALAKDGDIALRAGGLCIYSGNRIVTTGKTRLLFADRAEAACAWSLR